MGTGNGALAPHGGSEPLGLLDASLLQGVEHLTGEDATTTPPKPFTGAKLTLQSSIGTLSETILRIQNLDMKPLTDMTRKVIEELIRKEDKALLGRVLNFIRGTGQQIGLDEFDIQAGDFYKLTPYSKKKAVAHMLKEKYPDEVERKRVFNMIVSIAHYPELPEAAAEVGMDQVFEMTANAFSGGIINGLPDLKEEFDGMAIDDKHYLVELLKMSGVDRRIIEQLTELIDTPEDALISRATGGFQDGEMSSGLISLQEVKRKGFADFNPFIFDLNVPTGIKLFGEYRLREIYDKVFSQIAFEILAKVGGEQPSYNSLLKLNEQKLRSRQSIDQKDKDEYVYQHFFEWDIDASFDEKHLLAIAQMLDVEIGGFNMAKPGSFEPYVHPTRTMEGQLEYKGYFGDSGNRFLGNGVTLVREKKRGDKKCKLRVTLDDYQQDQFVYILAWIGHYLKTKKPLMRSQTYYEIYHNYNQKFLSNGKLYDIGTFDHQYKQMMEGLVIPLSLEAKELALEPGNLLMVGPYGAGKSQFLKALLLNKVFQYKDKDFHLNANCVYVDLEVFESTLKSGVGGFLSRLHDIYNKTKLPIILVIEDIDTLINEELHNVNDKVAQAMTVFFEGVGSVPVHIVTTSNDPDKISKRLMRPNRLYNIIEFYIPEGAQKEVVLKQHADDHGVTFSPEVVEKLKSTKLFRHGTASHYREFVKMVKKQKDLKVMFKETGEVTDEDIVKLADTMAISIDDLGAEIAKIKGWVKAVTGQIGDLQKDIL